MSFIESIVKVLHTDLTKVGVGFNPLPPRIDEKSSRANDESLARDNESREQLRDIGETRAPKITGLEDGRLISLSCYHHLHDESKSTPDLAFKLRHEAFGSVSDMHLEHMVSRPLATIKPGDFVDDESLPAPVSNSISLRIAFEGFPTSTITVVEGAQGELAADVEFPGAMARVRKVRGRTVGEITSFVISRENKSRRAIGGMFHVLYLYSAQARQINYIVSQCKANKANHMERLLGFERIEEQNGKVLMGIDMTVMRKHIRSWAGKRSTATDCPYVLYPYFFPAQDESGLLFRVLQYTAARQKPAA